MTSEIITIVFSILKFVLTKVNASNDTIRAFEALVKSTINDGLISKQSHKVFIDQYHDVEDQLNANTNSTSPTPGSK